MPPSPFGRSTHDRRAAGVEQIQASESPVSPTNARAAQDTWQTQGALQRGLHQEPLFLHGRVVDAIAHAHTYKVQCDRSVGVLQCCDASHGSLGLVGARPLHTYPIGSRVIVYYYPQELFGVILCSIPDWCYDPRHKLADSIVSASNVGLPVDVVHQAPLQLSESGIIDFSANRPVDSLQLGEWGAMTETGLRIFLDSFMAQLGVDESTMVAAFYFDQLLRVAGHNLQIWSAGHSFEALDDEGEASAVAGNSPYPWETSGAVDPGAVLSVEAEIDAVSGTRTRVEPVVDDLLPVHRDVEYTGYLGQGGKRVTQTPSFENEFSRYSDEGVTLYGLTDEVRTLSGDYGIRAARSVVIAKQPAIPAPRRRKRPEDPNGDSAELGNYLSAGLYGDPFLDPHNVVGELFNGNPDEPATEVAEIFDHIAYLFNWQGLHAFHYRSLDWYTPDESELVGIPILEFSSLDTYHYMAEPPWFETKIDDRYGLVRYFNSRAAIVLTPRGGITLIDAWGSQISMCGGQIEMHAAGDVVRTAGRTIVDRAGWDGIYLANNCVEVVANIGNVSIKADSNVMITGGNARCGGVLIQSLSEDIAFQESHTGDQVVGGIILRAKNSMVGILAWNVLVTTNAWGDNVAGRIVLDCGADTSEDSEANIILRANQVISHAASCVIDVLGEGESRAVNEAWKTHTIISNKFVASQESYLWGCTTIYEDLGVRGFIVSPLDNESGLTATNDAISGRNVQSTAFASIAETTHVIVNSPLEDVEFSFRDMTALKTLDYVAYEAAWHQLYRLGNDPNLINWWYDSVFTDDAGNQSQPYPGREVWNAADRYGLVTLNLYDPTYGVAVDRTVANYENAELGTITYVSLEGNWPVIRNP